MDRSANYICNICHEIFDSYKKVGWHATKTKCPKHRRAFENLSNDRVMGATRYMGMFTEANETNTTTTSISKFHCNFCDHSVTSHVGIRNHIDQKHAEKIANRPPKSRQKYARCFRQVMVNTLVYKKPQ